MDERFLQQLKKGVLELLVLETVCRGSTYGYELLTSLREKSSELFALREGTLYPILYRLEDDGLIVSGWSQGEGRQAPKKMYTATEKGMKEREERWKIWGVFSETVNGFAAGEEENEK